MYTLWQGDRLLGETDLTYEPLRPRHRGGSFFPSPGTEALIPTADVSLQIRDARGRVVPTDWVAVYDLEGPLAERDVDDFDDLDHLDDLEFAEVVHAEAAEEYEAVLLRDWLAQRNAFDEQGNDPLDDEFSRYQIQLMLADGATIP
jgi:hypothetical protein